MKSYLSLIPISAKVRRRQSRMTILCIMFAVFLVTAVFSMAEMGVRMEETKLLEKHGTLTIQEILGSGIGQSLFLIAAVLFVLILLAGVLMISSSLNSNVAQRIKFFGMMRCLGMSRQQIIRFVRLEALNWCRAAVPAGVVLGILSTWGLCAALRFLVGGEFSNIPLFGISIIGIVSGIVVGILTVLLAAVSPAKRASRVSPVTAVSGNSEQNRFRHSIQTRPFKIETALGIHHAVSAKKNLLLMTGSFALSMILFLSFTVLIDFTGYLLPQSSGSPDIDISSGDGSNSIDRGLPGRLSSMEGVKHVFGRRSLLDVPARLQSEAMAPAVIDMVSYDDFDLDRLTKDHMLKKGSRISKVYGDSNYVLAAWDKNSPWKIGDKIQTGNETLEIAGLLKYDLFSDDGLTNGKLTLITSGETFTRLTGVTDYSLLMVQTTKDASDKNVAAIRDAAGSSSVFRDKRDQSTAGTYTAFVFCIYAFLTIITFVTVLNMINCIMMSVSARTRQYGIMRAIGMDEHQLLKMIAAEAFTYAFLGCAAGCAVGLPFSRLLYQLLIADHFKYAAWSLPVGALLTILLFVVFTALIAVYAPAKRMRRLSVTETISEL